MRVDIYGAILKGLVEHSDAGRYLGSTLCLAEHLAEMHATGQIDGNGSVTDAGRRLYDSLGLARFPRTGRWYMWKGATL
jgi:hypothetical protein